MATLLTADVWKAITGAAKAAKKPAHAAVAFFGQKGPKLLPLPKFSSLVVDASLATVSQGGTCPMALEILQQSGVDIYSAQYLHAKVFAFDDVAFVGSANASERSAVTLIEAILQVDANIEISAVRMFVQSMCITKLTPADLKELTTFYKQPKVPSPNPKQGMLSTLLMELTSEQGKGRETQVQPPLGVWKRFFGLQTAGAKLPVLSLVNMKSKSSIKRQIVKHHHNYTIEINDAGLPRPAILQVRRLGPDIYSYNVHRPSDPSFAHIDHLVKTLPNPYWEPGRRWVLV